MSHPQAGKLKKFDSWRLKAITILGLVQSERTAPAEVPLFAQANGEERAWLTDSVMGVLRTQGRLDAAIDELSLKKKPTGWLRRALRVGAYSILYQDRVAPQSVVSEVVDLIKSKEGQAPSKFANALLRKLVEHAPQFREPEFEGSASRKAAWAAMPQAWWERIVQERGEAWARAYAEASLSRAPLWFHANPEFVSRMREWGFSEGKLPRSYRRAESGPVAGLPGFNEGAWIVQNIASQKLVADFAQEARGRGLDLCASPGGKSVALAWSGLNVVATDRPKRLALLTDTVARTRADIEVVSRPPEQKWDWIWVDAPCSSSGVIGRHPEIKWNFDLKTLIGLQKTQRDLLAQAMQAVNPGGYVMYSVCSVFKAEGPDVVNAALAAHTGWDTMRLWDLAPDADTGADGFWAVLLRRI